MAWIVLILSGIMEAVWATALGESDGFTKSTPTVNGCLDGADVSGAVPGRAIDEIIACAPRNTRYNAPRKRSISNATADERTTVAIPNAAAIVHPINPALTPNAVSRAARRPWSNAFLVISAISGPGVITRTTATPRNGRNSGTARSSSGSMATHWESPGVATHELAGL